MSANNVKELSVSLCSGRHFISQAKNGSIFGPRLDPTDINGIEAQANAWVESAVGSGVDLINLYVTGLKVALVAVIRASIFHNVDLVLWHYSRDNGEYLPQEVWRKR